MFELLCSVWLCWATQQAYYVQWRLNYQPSHLSSRRTLIGNNQRPLKAKRSPQQIPSLFDRFRLQNSTALDPCPLLVLLWFPMRTRTSTQVIALKTVRFQPLLHTAVVARTKRQTCSFSTLTPIAVSNTPSTASMFANVRSG